MKLRLLLIHLSTIEFRKDGKHRSELNETGQAWPKIRSAKPARGAELDLKGLRFEELLQRGTGEVQNLEGTRSMRTWF